MMIKFVGTVVVNIDISERGVLMNRIWPDLFALNDVYNESAFSRSRSMTYSRSSIFVRIYTHVFTYKSDVGHAQLR